MKFFSQSHVYDDPWSIVSLAFFLRYPNPYASHVVSADVINRTVDPESGVLRTTRLILKQGSLPRWAPRGILAKAESWILEESAVDAYGKEVVCSTRNLDHVKVMRVREEITLRALADGRTTHTSTVNIESRFGWGLTQRIEDHGVSRFRENLTRSREGLYTILTLLRQQPMSLGLRGSLPSTSNEWVARQASVAVAPRREDAAESHDVGNDRKWNKWVRWGRSDQ